MKKIRIIDCYNNYEIKEQMDRDLKIMIKQLKLTNPFKKYETKTYYDEKTKEYKCEIYDVSKLRVFEINYYDGKKEAVEINGCDKDIVYYFSLENVKYKLKGLSQIVSIKDIKSGKGRTIPFVEAIM